MNAGILIPTCVYDIDKTLTITQSKDTGSETESSIDFQINKKNYTYLGKKLVRI